MSKNKITLFYKNTLILTMLTVLLVACGGGEGGGPISEIPNTELAVPKNIQFVEHDGKVFVSWGRAKGALNYKLYLSKEQEIDLENIDEDVVNIYELEGTSTEISNLETNTPYFLAVASINGSQEKSFKLKKPVVLKSPPIDFDLSAPENLEVTGLEGEIEINWEPLPEAFNYLIFFSSTDNQVDPSSAQQIQEVGAPPFRHKGLSPNGTYYYRISAITPLGLTPLSDVVSASVMAFTAPPQTPDRFSASVGDSLVALKWEPVHRATTYNVYMAKEPILSLTDIAELDGGEVFFNISNVSTNRLDLENDITYYFRISAVNTNGESGISKMVSGTPKSAFPMVPSNISATSQRDGVKISWNEVVGAQGYYLYWFDQPNANKQTAYKSDRILENEFLDVNLTSQDTIYYFVTAGNDFGESEASAVVSVPVILPPAPVDVWVDAGLDKTTISWSPSSTEVEEYVLYLANETGIRKDNYYRLNNGKRLRNITSSEFEISRLLPDTQYYIAIASVNKGVEGGLSAELKFRTPVIEDVSTPPVISLIGSEQVSFIQGQEYIDLGATATDKEEGDLSDKIIVTHNVNSQISGVYTVRYNVVDSTKLAAEEVVRQVTVVENQRPVITLLGGSSVTIVQGNNYLDLGATATDKEEGDLSEKITVTNSVNSQVPGVYAVRYNVIDSAKLAAEEVVRQVTVVRNERPVITLLGSDSVSIFQGDDYIDSGATALDAEDGELFDIVVSGDVNTAIPGDYVVRFNVKDALGLAAVEVLRAVVVSANNPPMMVLNGDVEISLLQGQEYTEANATASDVEDGDLSSKIIITGIVNVNVAATYIVQYDVTDSFGVTATLNRTVVVKDFMLDSSPLDFLSSNMSANLFVFAVTNEDSLDVTQRGEWVSSNVDVISVSNAADSKGQVKAIAIGESVISVTYLGETATWNIKVIDPSVTLNYPFFITEKLKGGSLNVYLTVEDGARKKMSVTDAGLSLSLEGLTPGIYNIFIEIEFESDVYGAVMVAFSDNVMDISAGNNDLDIFALDYEYPDDNFDDESNLVSLISGTDPLGCAFDASLFGNCFWN